MQINRFLRVTLCLVSQPVDQAGHAGFGEPVSDVHAGVQPEGHRLHATAPRQNTAHSEGEFGVRLALHIFISLNCIFFYICFYFFAQIHHAEPQSRSGQDASHSDPV